MDDLIQIQLIGDVRSWFVVGLDRRGNVWYGQPQRPAGKVRGTIVWSQMEESRSTDR